MGQNLVLLKLFLLNLDFSNVLYQNLVFGARAGTNQALIGGAGAEIFYLEPEPKKNSWSRSRGKLVRLRNTELIYCNLVFLIVVFASALKFRIA